MEFQKEIQQTSEDRLNVAVQCGAFNRPVGLACGGWFGAQPFNLSLVCMKFFSWQRFSGIHASTRTVACCFGTQPFAAERFFTANTGPKSPHAIARQRRSGSGTATYVRKVSEKIDFSVGHSHALAHWRKPAKFLQFGFLRETN